MWDVFDVSVFSLPAAVVLWVAYALVAGAAPARDRLREGIGWAASLATVLAMSSIVPFVAGLFLFLPALWVADAGSRGAEVVAWIEALVLTAAVIWLAQRIFRRFPRTRFLSLLVLLLGLATVWLGRYLATVDWMPHPS